MARSGIDACAVPAVETYVSRQPGPGVVERAAGPRLAHDPRQRTAVFFVPDRFGQCGDFFPREMVAGEILLKEGGERNEDGNPQKADEIKNEGNGAAARGGAGRRFRSEDGERPDRKRHPDVASEVTPKEDSPQCRPGEVEQERPEEEPVQIAAFPGARLRPFRTGSFVRAFPFSPPQDRNQAEEGRENEGELVAQEFERRQEMSLPPLPARRVPRGVGERGEELAFQEPDDIRREEEKRGGR